MLIDQNGGSMAAPDLRELIEQRIPAHRAELEKSVPNLENLANFCEDNYLRHTDRNAAFEETKRYTLQSLASVAYQINTLARDLLDMLDFQADKITSLTNQIDIVNMVVNIHKEKLARREIGALTAQKIDKKQPKIITPAHQEVVIPHYKRTLIDYSLLDGVGHGTRSEPPPKTSFVTRAPSSVSTTPSQFGAVYSQYERTANIGTATLGRSSMHSGHMSVVSSDHYRVPQVVPITDNRYSRGHSQHGHNHGAPVAMTPTSIDYGSQHGSSEYGGTRYGTIRGVPPSFPRAESPDMPLPPQMISNTRYSASSSGLPRPMEMVASTIEDEPLPPPPPMANLFDTNADWVPPNYIEKAVALYDYDADKQDELNLRENCIVYVLRKNEDGWFEGVLDGVTGLFPGNYVQPL